MAKRKSPKSKNGKQDNEGNESPENIKETVSNKKIKSSSNSSKKQTLKERLNSLQAKELLSMMKDGVIISLKSNESLYKALQTLQEKKIISAPIFDDSKKEYIGFVDMIDLTAAVVDAAKSSGANKEEKVEPEDDNLDERILLESLILRDLIDFSKRDNFICVKESDSILKATELLCKRDTHRIGILSDDSDTDSKSDSNGKQLSGIITQTGLAEYLSEEFVELLEGDDSTVGTLLDKLPKEVFTAKEDSKAIDAFNLIYEKKVSALGIVDDKGVLIDTISVSDLMLWSEWNMSGEILRFSNLTSLSSNVKDFLENSRSQRQISNREVKTATEKDSIKDVMNDMLIENIHRVFIIDDSKKPISVITFGDILGHYI